MSTKFLSPGWRMPRNANQSKQSNYSLSFDGSSQYIDTTDKFDFIHNTKIFSISVWVKMDSYNTNVSSVILGNNYTSSQIGFQFWIDNRQNAAGRTEALKFNLWDGTNSSDLLEDNVVSDNNWHNYVVVGDGTTLKYYKDGTQLTDTDSLPASTSSTAFANLRLGANTISTPSAYLDGQINAVSIFDYALSQDQVTTLWGGGTSVSNPMALPSPPIAYYPLGTSAWNGEYLAENNAIGDYVFDFNGSNYIDCGNDSSFNMADNGTDPFTFSFWIKRSSTNNEIIISKQVNSGSYNGFETSIISNKIRVFLGSFLSPQEYLQVISTNTITGTDWKNIVITYDGSQNVSGFNIYINKVSETLVTLQNTTPSGILNSANFQISGRATSSLFSGSLSNVQYFNTVLSSTDIETLYNYGSPIRTLANIPQNSNLKAWYKLDASEVYNSTTTEWSIDNNQNPSAYASSLDFDGTDDYISIPNSTDFNLGSSFTISGWFNITSYVSNMGYISFDGSTRGWFLFHQNTNLALYDGTAVRTLSSNLQPTNEWNSYIITYNGTDLIFYLNGQLNSTQSVTSNLQTNGNGGQIGNQQFATGRFYNGSISNISIWNTALIPAQVSEIYNNGTPSNLSSHSATSNLISWWKLNNTTTGIEDAKGSNDGTNNGAIEYPGFVNTLAGDSSGMSQANLVQSDLQTVAPYSKYALDFDAASSDYIDCGSVSLNSNTGTFSTWIKTSYTSDFQIIAAVDSSPYMQLQYRVLQTGQIRLILAYSSTFERLDSTSTVNDGNWHHVAFTYSSSGMKIYIDGFLNVSNTVNVTPLTTATSNLFIGARSISGTLSKYFDGSLSNISIWNTALTSAQVTEIYNEGLPGNLNSHSAYSNLISWWQLGENSSFDGNDWIVADEKGTNNGTSTGMSVGALVNGVGTTANGVSNGMSEGNLVGDAPYSTANAISSGMSVVSRLTEVAPTPPLLLDNNGTDALLAVSMRKLRTDYTGFSMRIQRRGTAGSTGTADDQADLHFDSNNYTSLDSPITAVTSGVLSTTLGEFCAAPGYSNPDSMPSADTVEVVKFYNQTQNTAITQFGISSTSQLNELVTNGVLETITKGGSTFVALNCNYRESYVVSPGTSVMGGTPLSTFTVTNVKDPAGGFTTEDVSITPTAYGIPTGTILYDDTTDQLELFDQRNSNQILSSTNTFATDTPYLFSVLIQDAPDTTAYYVNNTLQASRTNFTHPGNISGIRYDQNNKAAGPEFMEAIYYNASKETELSSINQNIMNYYNLT